MLILLLLFSFFFFLSSFVSSSSVHVWLAYTSVLFLGQGEQVLMINMMGGDDEDEQDVDVDNKM